MRGNLREKLQKVIIRLNTEVNRLKNEEAAMEVREKELISKTTDALASGEQEKAKVYANEAAEVKKSAKVVFSTEIALERVALRLETALQLGDFAANLGSSFNVLKKVMGPLSEVMPETSQELSSIEEEVGSIMSEAQVATGTVGDVALSEDAEAIMKEAEALADSRVKEGFPEPPSEVAGKKRAR